MPTLLTASTTGPGLNVKGLVVLAVVFAVFYPLQRRFRAWASRRRIERWEHDDLLRPPPPVDEPSEPEPRADGSPDQTLGDGPTSPPQ
jgi:hypothetical protein